MGASTEEQNFQICADSSCRHHLQKHVSNHVPSGFQNLALGNVNKMLSKD